MGRKRSKQPMGLMALAGETAKMARSMMVLDKTEAALEKEMEKEEKRAKPITKIDKIRRKGEHMIHGKYLLLMVVILNVIDCLLVLGELILDIKYVTDLLTKEYERSEEFIGSMKGFYPARLGYLGPEDIEALEHEILAATLSWANHGNASSYSPTAHTTASTALNPHFRKRRASVVHDQSMNSNQSDHGNDTDHHGGHVEHHHAHSIEEEIAHGLHKASISILGILVVETIFKIFCFGRAMLEHKLECFDGFVVFVSFIVDIVFIKGLQQFTVQEFVLILAFMVPWRVIRVVNSLIVAIMDHEHFRLVLLYKQKKNISRELKEAKYENKGLEACVDALQKMCAEAGIPDTLVTARLNMYRKVKAKSNALGALSNFAVGGQAMNKPFTNGNIKSSDVYIVDETQAKQAKQLEGVLSEEHSAAKLAENTVEISVPVLLGFDLETARPRSRSAIESRVTKTDSELVKMLAENSATFIATMNKDDIELRMKIETLIKKHAEQKAEAQADGSDASESSTTDSYDSKQKADTEGLVKTKRDEDDGDEGSNTPTSRL